MSMYLNFEAHSWYMGFAIKKRTLERGVTEDTPIDYYLWQAYTDNGNTYNIDRLIARRLNELREKIHEYHLRKHNGYGERIAKRRLEYLRGELREGRMSYGELAELQGLIPYIDAGDVELLEAAGVPEFTT